MEYLETHWNTRVRYLVFFRKCLAPIRKESCDFMQLSRVVLKKKMYFTMSEIQEAQ